MRTFLLHLKDICYDKETGYKKRIILSLILILIGIGLIFWFFGRLLIFEGYFNVSCDIILPDVGQMGDFIGGVSGTLFTLVGVVLLFETLALQRIELSESRKVFERQQFETTFFNLLNLYNEVAKGLHFKDPNAFDEEVSKGKEFFEKQHKSFYNLFNCKDTISKNRKEATLNYIEFYTSTKEQTAHYFRTLYRIFRTIKESNFEDIDKLKYAKIVRAQLSESECFFIHYNAFTEYGRKFRELINEYNIVKHLPVIEKLEFKCYATNLTQMEKNSVQLVFDELKSFIKKSITQNLGSHKTYLSGSVSIQVKAISNYSFDLIIIRKLTQPYTEIYQQGIGLNKFDNTTLERIFVDYLFDLLNYSNYLEFNGRNLNILNDRAFDDTNSKLTITINVVNTNNKVIKFN